LIRELRAPQDTERETGMMAMMGLFIEAMRLQLEKERMGKGLE
jgi:hypothetical protein